MVQFMFLTPKPAAFPRPPKPEPYVGAILGTNMLCLILHIFSKTPSAGEATRFYLHGGLVLDFIGQKGPSSKLVLVLLDVFVLALQVVHLSAHITRTRLHEGISTQATVAVQDIESEERGVRRSTEIEQQDLQGDINLQSLNTAARAQLVAEEQRGEDWMSTSPEPDFSILESFWNGQIVLADLNPLTIVREQVVHYQQTPTDTRRNALNAQLTARMSELRYLTRRR